MELWPSSPDFPELASQRVKLTWKPSTLAQTYVDTVARDVVFDAQAERLLADGNGVPTRLDGRWAVGPLQFLSGAHPNDDVTVHLAVAQWVLCVSHSSRP